MAFQYCVIAALSLLLMVAPASADSIRFHIEEFEGELFWWRSYDGPESYTETGGPKSVNLILPQDVQFVHSVSITLVGSWIEGCVDAEYYGGCWVPTLHLSGGCVDLQVSPESEGLAVFEGVFTDCDPQTLLGQEFSLTIWTDRVDTNPTTSGSGIPSVDLYAVDVTYEVDTVVRATGDNWSTIKARYRPPESRPGMH